MDAHDGGPNAPRKPGRTDAADPAQPSGPAKPSAPADSAAPAEAPDASDAPPAPTAPTVPPTPGAPRDTHTPGHTGTPALPSTLTGPDTSTGSDMSAAPDRLDRSVPPQSRSPWPSPVPPAAPTSAVGPVPALTPAPRPVIAALSLRYQIGAALTVAVVAVVVVVHLGMVFLHVAPANTVTKQHGKAIEEWVYPEFEQNWKLFAPNPLQQNIAVQVRAQVRSAAGVSSTTGWYDLSAEDGRSIDGNLVPSHTQQNELRRSLDFYLATHDADNRPAGLRGSLAEQYLRRIVVLRLGRDDAAGAGGAVARVQVRSVTTNVPPPDWSDEQVSPTPVYRVLPWWSVPADEARGGVR
ncbi:DUF5819 family protein [Streptomyces sp. NPDC005423]|uniref:DUF5819 family protein n=1 Tax=Streptomyces sp. NPDC005423 TaxID=3155343 RepID=UPI0033B8754C